MSGSTGTEDHIEALASERAVDEAYREHMRKQFDDDRFGRPRYVATARNEVWCGNSPTMGRLVGTIPPIFGRVAIEDPDGMLGDGFYIGTYYAVVLSDVMVVEWDAPVASLFKQGRNSPDAAASKLTGIRTFIEDRNEIADYTDQLLAGRSERRIFPLSTAATLEVPKAPAATSRPRPGSTAKPPVAPKLSAPTPARQKKPVEMIGEERLVAPEAVAHAIARPRTGKLRSLVATLQPDQYDLVTWPHNRPLIVQGAPGTGKTVVALHRAAWLSLKGRRDSSPGRPWTPLNVAVVGPTREYQVHVAPVSQELGGVGVRVLGLPNVLCQIAGIETVPSHTEQTQYGDPVGVSWTLGNIVDTGVQRLRQGGAYSNITTKAMCELLFRKTPEHTAFCGDNESVSRWLMSAGGWQKAHRSATFLPFIASVALALQPPTKEDKFDHLVIDEAQDVPELVWRILLKLVRHPGALSVFGDMNQRRSDFTEHSWSELAVDLELTDDDGNAPVRELSIGYRSTQQILKFAGQLLPPKERSNQALRAGVPPIVRKVGFDQLERSAVELASSMADRHAGGLNAIIAIDAGKMRAHLGRAGWARDEVRGHYTKNGKSIIVLKPDEARGLEFDVVVVVEPASFPNNVGRHGVLYTSLTRATQELGVVHALSLPGKMKAALK